MTKSRSLEEKSEETFHLVACDCVNQMTYIGKVTPQDWDAYQNDGNVTMRDYEVIKSEILSESYKWKAASTYAEVSKPTGRYLLESEPLTISKPQIVAVNVVRKDCTSKTDFSRIFIEEELSKLRDGLNQTGVNRASFII